MDVRYDKHAEEWHRSVSDPERRRIAETWWHDDRVDSWRHARMRSHALPFIRNGADRSWLTVGDGRFGTDAHFLLTHGAQHVVATDFSDELLKIGAERGFITECRAANAEALPFEDGSFDFVYCKESYHHFPRPPVAFYEMLRVARIAVIMTEPNDRGGLATLLVRAAKAVLGRSAARHQFEPVGNYLYTVTRREIEKLMLAIGLRHYAYRWINDFYIQGVEDAPIIGGSAGDAWLRIRVRAGIAAQDLGCRIGILQPGLLTLAVFKDAPPAALRSDCIADGYAFSTLPANPYR